MSEKILVIDDDPVVLKIATRVLQRAGYEVITAADATDGLNKAAETSPDLVILDVMLPGMDGFDVCRYLRSNPETAHLPIIMFTGKVLPREQQMGYTAGADDYLTKPVNATELLSRVESTLFFAGARM